MNLHVAAKTQAIGSRSTPQTIDHPHRFTVFLHQDEFGPTFQLVDRFSPTLEYPTEAASIFTVDCDIAPRVRPILAPDITAAERVLLISGLAASGALEAGSLARGIRDMLNSKMDVVRRFARRDGPDHWRNHIEALRRISQDM